MNGRSDVATDGETVQTDSIPESLSAGSTVLVASAGDPSQHAVGLRVLRQSGGADDTALVVTTTESADRTVETYERLPPAGERTSLGIVDTTSEHQSVSALYGETPAVFTPSPGDLERLVMALSEISGSTPPSNGARHLVFRSLTPILETTSTDRVCRVLERTMGLQSPAGLCLFGLDYTAHDEETMARVTELVDGVLWVTRSSEDRLEFEYRPAKGRYTRSMASGETGG